MKRTVSTEKAPKAIGPYSQAVIANGLVFVSGQIPIDPVTGQVIEGDSQAQTERVLTNLRGILEAAGSSLDHVVRTTVFLKSLADFSAVNDVYARFFPQNPPGRSTVEVSRLPRDVQVEIDCIAVVP